MLSLSFKEFFDFSIFDDNITIEEKFNGYIKFGAMPGVITLKNIKDNYKKLI